MAGDEGIEIYEERDQSMDLNNEAEVKSELGKEGGDENVLQFLDSLDGYLTLMDSLNSKLREVTGNDLFFLSCFGLSSYNGILWL